MLVQKTYERHSSQRNRPIGRVTATLARARRPKWVDTLLIDSPLRTTQVERAAGAASPSPSPSRGLDKSPQSNLLVSHHFSRSDPSQRRRPGASPARTDGEQV